MKIENLKDFSAKVKKSDFFDFLQTFDDWDSLLDRRDEDDFDASWVKNNEHVASAGYGAPTDESEITELREYAFKTVMRITNNSEAAGYISDDIGLLAEAFSKKSMTTWLNDLLSAYLSGNFPH
ncbi:hypothetical protein ABNM12_11810 [Pseudomonas syringae]|uniref:hypothetical protein n=1 Tax=Pseudomonas TaxID=286 RepID=UPI000516A7C0|nr:MULTISPECIES: hypothetical protein [Pseudomonas]KWS18014.1 hypothetical protein AL062_26780 [Pseudomonas syringae pv. syringae]KWS23722.1 hypothetical protein AL061_21905 [Pseudomonas syringae pv. syringae]MDY2566612.1 hypothetical protein [Pseudomonas syringae]PBP89725.1 hypothetical protein CCL16_09525 [Pseudomonas syringae]RXT60128.1 hypothetical protein B1F74_25715 [Pseudomonas syringae]